MDLLTIERVSSTLCRVAGVSPFARPVDIRLLRNRAFTELARIQRLPCLLDDTAPSPRLVFDPHAPGVRAHLSAFMAEAPEPALPAIADFDVWRERFSASLDLLRQFDPRYPEALAMLVHTLLFIPLQRAEYGGASLGEAPGVVWIRPDPNWEPRDLAESLLHEAVHQAVFLHDMAWGYMTDEAFADEARVFSAVRSVYMSGEGPLRTYCAAFHAACVAAYLIPFFVFVCRPDRAQTFSTALARSLPELLGRTDLLTPNGRQVLEQAQASLL